MALPRASPQPAADDEAAAKMTSARPRHFAPAIIATREQPELTPGAILRVQLDEPGSGQPVMADSGAGRTLGLHTMNWIKVSTSNFAIEDRILASVDVGRRDGAVPRRPSGSWRDGAGAVHHFAEGPNYRAYAEMAQFLFINTVLARPGVLNCLRKQNKQKGQKGQKRVGLRLTVVSAM